MRRTIGKTVVLSILVVTSIYQLAMLWFDYPSDRNFFLNFIDTEATFSDNDQETAYDLYYPTKVATLYEVNLGNYVLKDLNNPDDVIEENMFDVVKQALESGNVNTAFIPENELWDEQHVLLFMPFSINAEVVRDRMKIDSSWFKESMDFDRVYLYPGIYADDYLRLVFADSTLTKRFSCQIPVGNIQKLNDLVLDYLEEAHGKDETRYVSTKRSELPWFEEDQLLPGFGQTFDLVQNIYGERYFYTGDERDSEAIRTFVDYFLVNPEVAWSTENPVEVRYGDLEVVISYNDKGLLSYSFINEIENKNTDLNNAYAAALEFMEKDTILSQIEYALVDYDYNQDEASFYFDYEYRGVPILFDGLTQEVGISHPLQIVVTGNTVKSYERLLWKTEEVLIQGDSFEVSYKAKLDQIIPELGEALIDNMYIGYYSKRLADGAYLMWIVDTSEERGLTYELE